MTKTTLKSKVDAADEARFADVLRGLLAAWAKNPHPDVAAMIDRASELARGAASPRGKTDAAIAGWLALEANGEPGDVPALVEALADVSSGDAKVRIGKLAARGPDPRIEAALVGLLEVPPWRATSTKPVWTALFQLLDDIRDVRLVPRLDALDGKIAATVATTMADWMRGKLRAILERRRPVLLAPVGDPPKSLAALAKRIEARAPRPKHDLAALLAAVYAHPGDDAPRMVYADALLEAGDPRGEFITLQCTGGGRARIGALLAAHGKSWLGPLAPIVQASYTFERGFLATCTVKVDKLDRVEAVTGAPMWSTVRALAGSARIALDPVMRSLRELTFDAQAAAVHERLPDAWRDLLATTTRPLVSLDYHARMGRTFDHAANRWVEYDIVAELAALARCEALPDLRELAIDAMVNQPRTTFGARSIVGQVVQGPVLARLQALTVRVERAFGVATPIAEHADLMSHARVPALRFVIGAAYEPTTIELTGAGAYTAARITAHPSGKHAKASQRAGDEIVATIALLPPTVTALGFDLGRGLTAADRARITDAARARGLA